MHKEDVVHIYNEILFSHKKNEMQHIDAPGDAPRDHHTSEKSQKEKEKSHICGI